jgi:DNA-binding response OmpR family regulator
MKLKALVLGHEETTQMICNLLVARGIEVTRLYEVPETINILKQENFNLAVVDSSINDIESVCFRLIWVCRIRVAVTAKESDIDWNTLKSVGVEDFVSVNSDENQLVQYLEEIAHKGSYKFNKIKVIAIEDDKHIREAIRFFFQIYWPEAQVNFAAGGEDGVNLAKSKPADIILLDLGLPDISGFEVLNWIRNFSTVPIIILTAAREKDLIVKAIQSGANDYVVKPFKQMDLMPRIRRNIDVVPIR